jgi:4-hydroxy-3-methylbut-2-enyl diphosphate reductase
MGFCFGVKRAINLVERAARQYGRLETLGPLVHNQRVVDRMAGLGVRAVDNLEEISGPRVVIASHGVGPQVVEEIRSRHLQVIDATCPWVCRAQKAARSLAESSFLVILLGDAEHPEVKGVLGWAGDRGIAVQDEKGLPDLDRLPRRLGIISQSTQSPARFAEFAQRVTDLALARSIELRIVNTICDATKKRQAAALDLAHRVGGMIVVGGRSSANTRRLAELCSGAGVEAHLVETAAEIEEAWLKGHHRLGVTAGASTPDEAIDEVVCRLEELAGQGV